MMSTNYGLDNGNYRDMDGNKGWRLDFDPEKVVHVNIFDFTKGKGLGIDCILLSTVYVLWRQLKLSIGLLPRLITFSCFCIN